MSSNRKLLVLISIAGTISAADNWIASLLLPSIADTFETSVTSAAAVLSAYLLPYGLLQPVYGYCSDRYGRKKILVSLMFFLALFTLFCSLSKSLSALIIFRFFTGCAAAGVIAVSLGILGDEYSEQDRQKFVGIFLGSVFLGQGLSAGLGGWIVSSWSWRASFLIFCILSAASFISLFALDVKNEQTGKKDEISFMQSLKFILKDKSLLKVYLLAFCNGIVVLGAYSFVGAYLLKKLNTENSAAGVCLMLYGIACFFAGNANRFLKNFISPDKNLILGFLASFLALCFLGSYFVFAAFAGTFLLGLGYVLVQSVLASEALRPKFGKGLSSGIIGVAIFFGGGVGTAVGGEILRHFDYRVLFLSFAVFLAVLLVFYCADLAKARKIKL
ncbi:MFS transporter [Campylobacter curvus]|uniref:MFS transporter n=1 Tax=Campylobacter curvus TaxID=200 RepID=UPI0019D2B9C8|nr:MFS transporter [Campylobacter curvus]MBN7287503.1 MFS transporter [Campylobacter curvus]